MARFSVDQAEKFGGQGGSGYFSLKNDKDTARVRFMFNDINDVEGYSVHEVEINSKKRYVSCLREYGRPMSDCPFCARGKFTQVKYFVPIYNEDTSAVQTWERGKKFGAKLASMCSRYAPVSEHVFEIERNGKPGDTSTSYEIYEVGDATTDISEVDPPRIIGGLVLEKSADELAYYLDYNEFPSTDDAPSRRPARGNSDNNTVTRRTPMGSGRREIY